jgi:hypothetical protein
MHKMKIFNRFGELTSWTYSTMCGMESDNLLRIPQKSLLSRGQFLVRLLN